MEGDDQPEMYCVMGQMSAWLGVRCPGTWLSFSFLFLSVTGVMFLEQVSI